MNRRRILIASSATLAIVALGGAGWTLLRPPPDTTPEGAYMRIAVNIGRGDVRVVFSYLEDDAQHAAYTLRDYRKKASEVIARSFPEPERSRLIAAYRAHAVAEDGADVWLDLANERGWVDLLRRDMSGVASVEVVGPRATVQTARGTRYAFRRRHNGMWGMTRFTAELVGEAERAARDYDVAVRAAKDYDSAAKRE